MTATDTLRFWAEACESAEIKWYLYKETLLCAKGLGMFPDELESVQVAVMAKDLPAVLSDVIPRLPREWNVDKQSFLQRESLISVVQDQKTVMTIDALCGIRSDDERNSLISKVDRLWSSARGTRSLFKLFCAILGAGLRKRLKRMEGRIHNKTFHSLINLLVESKSDGVFFCDCFAKNAPIVFRGSPIFRTEMVFYGDRAGSCEW